MSAAAERVIVAAERLHAAAARLRPLLRTWEGLDPDVRRLLERIVDGAGDYAFHLDEYDKSEHDLNTQRKGEPPLTL